MVFSSDCHGTEANDECLSDQTQMPSSQIFQDFDQVVEVESGKKYRL